MADKKKKPFLPKVNIYRLEKCKQDLWFNNIINLLMYCTDLLKFLNYLNSMNHLQKYLFYFFHQPFMKAIKESKKKYILTVLANLTGAHNSKTASNFKIRT